MESALLLVQVSPSVDADETTDEEGSLLRRRTGGDASLGPMALWSDRKVDRVWIFVEQKVKSSTWGMTMVTTHFAFVDVDVVIRYLLNLELKLAPFVERGLSIRRSRSPSNEVPSDWFIEE